MTTLQLHLMSRAEKLRTMEALWDDLSNPPEAFDSPGWHDDELAKTEREFAEGKQDFVTWEAAKRQLNDT